MKFEKAVENAISRLEKDGIWLRRDWAFNKRFDYAKCEEQKKALWKLAIHAKHGPNKSCIAPREGVRLVCLGVEEYECGTSKETFFALISEDSSLFLCVEKDYMYGDEGERVIVGCNVPEYMLAKFAKEPVAA